MSLQNPLLDSAPEETSQMPKRRYSVDSELKSKFSDEEMITLKQNFLKFDANGDGTIDANELAVVMNTIGESCTREQLLVLLKEGDTDGDGMVSFPEFVHLVHKTKKVCSCTRVVFCC